MRTVRLSTPQGHPATSVVSCAITGARVTGVRLLRPYTLVGGSDERWKAKIIFMDGSEEVVFLVT